VTPRTTSIADTAAKATTAADFGKSIAVTMTLVVTPRPPHLDHVFPVNV
jgi:hypothetical protein